MEKINKIDRKRRYQQQNMKLKLGSKYKCNEYWKLIKIVKQYVNKYETLDEMNELLKECKNPKLSQEKLGVPDTYIFFKSFKSLS